MNRKLLSLFAALIVSVGLMGSAIAGGSGSGYVMGISPATAGVEQGASFQTGATLSSDSSDGEVQGWSYGICHDDTHFQLDSVGNADTDTVKNGSPADFNEIGTFSDGYTQGVVICFTGCATVAAGTTITMTNGNYTAIGAENDSSDIAVCNTLGAPPVAVAVVTGGSSVSPGTNSSTVTIVPPPPTIDFRRGDTNDDGVINIADIVWLLAEMFQGGPVTDCTGADDTNSDGTVDAADAIYLAAGMFQGGPDPAAPYPDCGGDSDPEPGDCAEYNSCP